MKTEPNLNKACYNVDMAVSLLNTLRNKYLGTPPLRADEDYLLGGIYNISPNVAQLVMDHEEYLHLLYIMDDLLKAAGAILSEAELIYGKRQYEGEEDHEHISADFQETIQD